MRAQRVFSNEQAVLALRLLALRLWRSPMAKDWREHGCKPGRATIHQRFGRWDAGFLRAAGLPAPIVQPSFGVSPGHRVYWTRKRVIEGMRQARAELGYFPTQARHWLPLKKGRLDWPREDRIRQLGGGDNGNGTNNRSAWRRAMIVAGLGADVPDWQNGLWTESDDEYLLSHAGSLTLKRIAFHLGRSVGACRRHLYDRGTRARDARGYYTASVLAQYLEIPLKRVLNAIYSGRLQASRPAGRPYWQIDPDSVERNREWLTRSKVTHTSTPPVSTDWYKQNELKRNGKGQIIGLRQAVVGVK